MKSAKSLRNQIGVDDKVVSGVIAANKMAATMARLGFCNAHLKVKPSSVTKIVSSFEKLGFKVWTEETVIDPKEGCYVNVSVEW